jgi:autotransporter passenger strand-loop-strand repeat protein
MRIIELRLRLWGLARACVVPGFRGLGVKNGGYLVLGSGGVAVTSLVSGGYLSVKDTAG